MTDDPALDYTILTEFGKRAQTEVVTKQDAYDTAAAFGADVSLTEHGGTGIGVIGALAGAGLRAGKEEGRIKGKLHPLPGRAAMTVREFAGLYALQQVVDTDGHPVDADLVLTFTEPTKAVFRGGKVTGVVCCENGVMKPLPKRKKEKK